MYIFIWEHIDTEAKSIIFPRESDAKAAINDMLVRDLPDLVVIVGTPKPNTGERVATTMSGKDFVTYENPILTMWRLRNGFPKP